MSIVSNPYKYLSIRNVLFFLAFLLTLSIIAYYNNNPPSTTEFEPTCTNGIASTEKVSAENTENCTACTTVGYALTEVGDFMECSLVDTDGDGTPDMTDLDDDDDGTPDINDVDSDGDGLIEIDTLNDLATIRDDLDGDGVDDGLLGNVVALGNTGCGGLNNVTPCIGYELMRDLDFADNSSYDASEMNMSWRPLNTRTFSKGSSIVMDLNTAKNAGWIPIGDCNGVMLDNPIDHTFTCGDSDDKSFSSIFQGNGFTISNLYARDTGSTGVGLGLFGLTDSASKIRNVGLVGGAVFGGGGLDYVGGLVGFNSGSITASYATGDAAGGGVIDDYVGGLVGYNFGGSITASYATGNADGGVGAGYAGYDYVGGLVGYNNGASITASYATGSVDGGGGIDSVGGLVGFNDGSITASYATGSADGGAGFDRVGGLVGQHNGGSIIASYATGDADGGAGADFVGGLVGDNFDGSIITASYAFGSVANVDTSGSSGTTPPNGVMNANDLVSGNFGTTWDFVWDFGTPNQPPALKYADYDGTGSIDYCKMFPVNITCGITLLPGPNETRPLETPLYFISRKPSIK